MSSAFGERLKVWRKRRGHTQLSLALEAGYSQRHLSFLESGRSAPSRAAVAALGEALDLPFRAQDELLAAAGFAARPRRREDDPALALARRQLETVIERHAPFPAVLVDRLWNLLHANGPAIALFTELAGPDAVLGGNVLLSCLDPAGLKPRIVNWDSVAHGFLRRLEREMAQDPDDGALAQLVERVREVAGSSDATSVVELDAAVEKMVFRHPEQELAFFSLVSAIGTPRDATLADLHLETFLPADEVTRRWLLARS